MIARFRILLPYLIFIPENEQFSDFEFDLEGLKVRISPPFQSTLHFHEFVLGKAPTLTRLIDELKPASKIVVTDSLLIDGRPVIECNCIQIDFIAEDFIRNMNKVDNQPSWKQALEAANIFLTHFRTVTQSSQAQQLVLGSNTAWTLQYLNDDQSELPRQEGKMRQTGGLQLKGHFTRLTKSIWEQVKIIPTDYSPPNFQNLILDADKILPDIGASIVLMYSSIESIISWALKIAASRSAIPKELSTWILEKNDDNWMKLPSTSDKLSILLKIFAGKSLKEDKPDLWKSFTEIRKIRNGFVHEGKLSLDSVPIGLDAAQKYLEISKQIISFIEGLLPKELTRPLSTDRSEYQFIQNVSEQPISNTTTPF